MRKSFDTAVITLCRAVALIICFVLAVTLHASGLQWWALSFIGGLVLGRRPMRTSILGGAIFMFLITAVSREALGGWLVAGLIMAAAFLMGVCLIRVAQRGRTVL
ncbi:hypothetical protein ASE61_11905 [Bosea sp. Root670]|nr:hypothetical protein ASE61_11905 [Bosea sp. Root670]